MRGREWEREDAGAEITKKQTYFKRLFRRDEVSVLEEKERIRRRGVRRW